MTCFLDYVSILGCKIHWKYCSFDSFDICYLGTVQTFSIFILSTTVSSHSQVLPEKKCISKIFQKNMRILVLKLNDYFKC